MANIRTLDFQFLDQLFRMGSGYVLDFSDRTMGSYFAEELNVDINDPAYAKDGTSKAKRLRCFLRTVDTKSAVDALLALWKYRQAIDRNNRTPETIPNEEGRFHEVLNRIQGITVASSSPAPWQQPHQAPVPAFDRHHLQDLRARLLAVSGLQPHARGYEFERFLNSAFNFFGLAAREPFRLRGEQIDGSFELDHETYLWKRNGTPNRPAPLTCTFSRASSARRPSGRAVCSSATVDSPKKDWMRSAAGSGSSAWTASTSAMHSSARFP